jgi:hypothetical protein
VGRERKYKIKGQYRSERKEDEVRRLGQLMSPLQFACVCLLDIFLNSKQVGSSRVLQS